MTARTLTTSQAARQLGLSAERVRQLSEEGTLRCEKTPLGRLYATEDLARFAKARNHQEHPNVEEAE